MVHGLALKNEALGRPYFNRIPAQLESQGFEVFHANHLAWGDFETNADILFEDIRYLTQDLGYEKVNIIAHSKGGLDSRFMFWKYQNQGVTDMVASLTTITSPHYGSVTADSIFGFVPTYLQWIPARITNLIAWLQGEWDTDSLSIYASMRTEDMKFFNHIVGEPNQGCGVIYCQSWGAVINGSVADKMSEILSRLNRLLGKEANDGLVSGSSAMFGNFRGMARSSHQDSLSHLGIIDRGLILREGGTPGFDPIAFYSAMASELAEFGF